MCLRRPPRRNDRRPRQRARCARNSLQAPLLQRRRIFLPRGAWGGRPRAFATGGVGEEAAGVATAEEDAFTTRGAGEEAVDAAVAEDDTFAVGSAGEEAAGLPQMRTHRTDRITAQELIVHSR